MTVCVVGNFGDGVSQVTDGQRIKTVELYRALVRHYGENEVSSVNLYSKKRIKLAFKLFLALLRNKKLIVLVAENGRRTVIPLLVIMNLLFHREIYHSLIGSTTHDTLEKRPRLIPIYNRLAGNWTETSIETELLIKLGLNNVRLIKNFKQLPVLQSEQLVYQTQEPYRFCTFSRIEELKGFPDVVNAIKEVNRCYGRTVCELDIYGKVQDDYREDFDRLQQEFGPAVRYKGIVDFDKSIDTIKDYYMLIFPTRYYTEGIPGTILDAFASGVPLLSAEWGACFDILDHSTAVTYDFDCYLALVEAIKFAVENPKRINMMKQNCLEASKAYSPDEVIRTITEILEEDNR